jgi:hypothetical protein
MQKTRKSISFANLTFRWRSLVSVLPNKLPDYSQTHDVPGTDAIEMKVTNQGEILSFILRSDIKDFPNIPLDNLG